MARVFLDDGLERGDLVGLWGGVGLGGGLGLVVLVMVEVLEGRSTWGRASMGLEVRIGWLGLEVEDRDL